MVDGVDRKDRYDHTRVVWGLGEIAPPKDHSSRERLLVKNVGSSRFQRVAYEI